MKRSLLLLLLNCLLAFSGTVNAQCTFTSSVPYFESFSSLTTNNQLPTCWSTPNIGSTSLTYTNSTNAFSGGSCASFYHSPAGTRNFYSNGIQLNAGVIYSVNVFYKTDNAGGTNWSQLQLGIGPSQTVNGTTVVALVSSPNSSVYMALASTFSVSNSGLYYLSISAAVVPGASEQLYFDNVSISIPCTGPGAANAPTVSISATNGFTTTSGSTSICANPQSTLTALGANSYSWNGGITTATRVLGAGSPGSIFVIGTNTLTGCSASTAISQIFPVPSNSIQATASVICPGETTTLSVSGANTYTWFNATHATTIALSPTLTTTYSVIGTFTNTGCKNTTMFTVTVQSPTVIITANSTVICNGSTAALNALGTANYTWTGGQVSSNNASIAVTPSATTIYTVTGSNSSFCWDTTTIKITVLATPTLALQGSTFMCKGQTLTLVASGASTIQFQGNILSQTNGTATVSPPISGNYVVIGTDPNGCTDSLNFSITVDKCIGINSHSETTASIFPNPFHDRLYVQSEMPVTLTIWSTTGQQIAQFTLTNGFITTDVLPPGFYSIELEKEGRSHQFKFIKE